MKNIDMQKLYLKIILVFIISSPFIDLITSLMLNELNFALNVGIILRGLLFLLFVIYLTFLNSSRYKKTSLLIILILFLSSTAFLVSRLYLRNSLFLFEEIKNLFKILFAPISVLFFINYFDNNEGSIKKVFKSLVISFIFYLVLIIIPIILGNSYLTYPTGRKGFIGWFSSPNEISSLLVIMFPLVYYYFYNFKKIFLSVIGLAIVSYIMLAIGTKVPLFGIAITISCYILYFIIHSIATRKILFKKIAFLLASIIVVGSIFCFFSPIKNNFKAQQFIVQKVYEENDSNGMIFSSRNLYIKYMNEKFSRRPVIEKLMGLGYKDRLDKSYNTVEIDAYDIYYQTGIIGIVAYASVFLVIIIYLIIKVLKNIKVYIFDDKKVYPLIAIALGFAISAISGHTLVAPAVSIYIGIFLGIAFSDTKYLKKQNAKDIIPSFENVLGVNVTVTTYDEMAKNIKDDIKKKNKSFIVAINPEKVLKARKDQNLKNLLNDAKYKIPDGVGIIYASKLQGGFIKSRITGIDSMELLCQLAMENRYKVFMYGAKKETGLKAKEKIEEKYKGINIVGYIDGYEKDNAKIIKEINKSQADIIFVALGSPKQEYWIVENMKSLNVTVFQGVGGSFDVFSGNIARAPKWMQNCGLEWLYRLLKEPKRIFRQMNLFKFLFLIIIGKKD